MRLFPQKIALVLLGLLILILIVVIPLIAFLILAEQQEHIPGRSTPTPGASRTPVGALAWPVISRDVPVFASSMSYPASIANDEIFNTSWRSKALLPEWLMISPTSLLSGVAGYSLFGITRHITITIPSLGTLLTICLKIILLTFIQTLVVASRQSKDW